MFTRIYITHQIVSHFGISGECKYHFPCRSLKHIVAGLQCVSGNKSSLGSMVYWNITVIVTVTLQITNINTWQDRSHKIIHNQRETILYDSSKKYKIKHFSTSYFLWEKYHNIQNVHVAYSSNKYTIK
jgi:hypothetical protein